MIILDERNVLSKELESHGFDVFDFFEGTVVLSMKKFLELEVSRRGEFLLVDTQTILNHPQNQESFKVVLNTFQGAVFFHDHSNASAQKWVEREGAFLSRIIGEYALPMPQLSWTILSNQLQFYWSLIEDQKKLQKSLVQLSRELDGVLLNAETEMERARKINEAIVPRRREEIRGISFANKYTSGDGGGVEFYDLYQTPTHVYQILISTDSYLISSSLLRLLEGHRSKDFDAKIFLQDAREEIRAINATKNKKSFADVTLLALDLSSLILTCLTDSLAEFHSQVKGMISLSKDQSYPLTRGEKLIVFSPGFIFNWKSGHPDKELHNAVSSLSELSSQEYLSELFIRLKEKAKDQFSSKDATVALMEVNRHGIYKI